MRSAKQRHAYFGRYAPRSGQEAPLPAHAEALWRVARRKFDASSRSSTSATGDRKAPARSQAGVDAAPDAAPSGALTPLLQQLYRVGTSPDLIRSLEAAVANFAAALPALAGRIALLLDASASMRGGGRQEFAPIALAVAFERVLQATCPGLHVYQIGGFGWPPAPEGPTDFGRLLIDALEAGPDLVVFVTDGYENLNAGRCRPHPGDTPNARRGDRRSSVAASRRLRAKGGLLPLRRQACPPCRCARSEDFGAAFQVLDLLAAPQEPARGCVERLRARREVWETEAYRWTVAS